MNTPSRNTLIRYIRNKKGQKKGVVVAVKGGDNTVNVGWSLCSRRDTFDKEVGLALATVRAMGLPVPGIKLSGALSVPQTVKPHYVAMLDRAQRYFNKV